jgi:hypothetical protein
MPVTAGRSLHFDEYWLGVLLYLFNPAISSLRGIQQASQLCNVQKKLGIKRASLGSLSESVSVFDPEPLKEIATELAKRVPGQVAGDFSQINQTLTAVDGSVFDTVARVAELAWVPLKDRKRKHAYRLHTQFEILRGVPNRIEVTSANPKGEDDERAETGTGRTGPVIEQGKTVGDSLPGALLACQFGFGASPSETRIASTLLLPDGKGDILP